MSRGTTEAARDNHSRVGLHSIFIKRSPTMFASADWQWSRGHAGRNAAVRRRRRHHRLEWESLELRSLMATLIPGNPVTIGTPTTFSGVGGTNTSGGAFDALTAFETAIGG